MSKVDELKDRFIEMIDEGMTRFGWTAGPQWHSLSIEEKAAAILQHWDAPKREPCDHVPMKAELDDEVGCIRCGQWLGKKQ